MSGPTVHDLLVGLGVGVVFAATVAVCVGVYLVVVVPIAWRTVRELPPVIGDVRDRAPVAGQGVTGAPRGLVRS